MLLPLANNESIRGWYYSASGPASEVASCSECGAMPSRIIIIDFFHLEFIDVETAPVQAVRQFGHSDCPLCWYPCHDKTLRLVNQRTRKFSVHATKMVLSNCRIDGVSLYPTYEKPFRHDLPKGKNEGMAERVGFEPTIPVKVYTLSKRAPSATRPSLRRNLIDPL